MVLQIFTCLTLCFFVIFVSSLSIFLNSWIRLAALTIWNSSVSKGEFNVSKVKSFLLSNTASDYFFSLTVVDHHYEYLISFSNSSSKGCISSELLSNTSSSLRAVRLSISLNSKPFSMLFFFCLIFLFILNLLSFRNFHQIFNRNTHNDFR